MVLDIEDWEIFILFLLYNCIFLVVINFIINKIFLRDVKVWFFIELEEILFVVNFVIKFMLLELSLNFIINLNI